MIAPLIWGGVVRRPALTRDERHQGRSSATGLPSSLGTGAVPLLMLRSRDATVRSASIADGCSPVPVLGIALTTRINLQQGRPCFLFTSVTNSSPITGLCVINHCRYKPAVQ